MHNAVNGITIIFILISVGFVLYKIDWIKDESERFITKFTLKISVPCALFSTVVKHLKSGLEVVDKTNAIIPFISIIVTLILGIVLAKLLKADDAKKGLSISIFTFSNTIIIGLPVCTSVLGESSIPFVIIYYAANTILFWTVGASLIAADNKTGNKFNMAIILKNLLSPALLGFFGGALVVFSDITIPKPIDASIAMLGQLNTPLCMVVVGSTIAKLKIRELFTFDKAGLLAILGRIIIAPLIAMLILVVFKQKGIAAKVILLMSAMPAMNQSVLVAKNYGSDHVLASKILSASSLTMLVVLPLYSLLADILF